MVVPITLVHEKTVYHVTLPTTTIAALRDAVEEATTVIGHGARLIVKGKTLPSTGPCPPPQSKVLVVGPRTRPAIHHGEHQPQPEFLDPPPDKAWEWDLERLRAMILSGGVDLSRSHLTRVSPLPSPLHAAHYPLDRLRVLDLAHNHLVDLPSLHALTRLKRVNVSHNCWASLGTSVALCLPDSVEELDVGSSRGMTASAEDVQVASASLPRLRILRLGRSRAVEANAAWRAWSDLQHLDLTDAIIMTTLSTSIESENCHWNLPVGLEELILDGAWSEREVLPRVCFRRCGFSRCVAPHYAHYLVICL